MGAEDVRIGWYITSLVSEALLFLSNYYHESVATPGSANVCRCRVQDACLASLFWPWGARFEGPGNAEFE